MAAAETITYFPNGVAVHPNNHAAIHFSDGTNVEYAELYEAAVAIPTAPQGRGAQIIRNVVAPGAGIRLSPSGTNAAGDPAKLQVTIRSQGAGGPNHDISAV